jgi:hypothetical protein
MQREPSANNQAAWRFIRTLLAKVEYRVLLVLIKYIKILYNITAIEVYRFESLVVRYKLDMTNKLDLSRNGEQAIEPDQRGIKI